MSQREPSALSIALAGIALLLIPISVVAFFSVRWWLAFIPLGFIVLSMLYMITATLGRMFKDVRMKGSVL